VVLAKVGLDGHDRGIKVVFRALRDAGLWQTPEAVVRTIGEIMNALGDVFGRYDGAARW
jgi:methylmalonyl-CoA mutase cobalamin-binding domain/chain